MVNRRSGGYTLVEVMCAFAVLSVLFSTVFMGEGNQLRAVNHSFQESAARQLAAASLGFHTAFVGRPSEYGPHQSKDFAAEHDFDLVADSFTDLAERLEC